MGKKQHKKDWSEYYDEKDILDELVAGSADFSLDEVLLKEILSKDRKRRLQNVTIKIDPLHLRAIRKLATAKSIPYQTLVRHWLSEQIKKELHLS
jgi:predicted DNA binding CopG/RHH family protein